MKKRAMKKALKKGFNLSKDDIEAAKKSRAEDPFFGPALPTVAPEPTPQESQPQQDSTPPSSEKTQAAAPPSEAKEAGVPNVIQRSPTRMLLVGLRKLREQLVGSKISTPQQDQLRRDLIKVSNQMIVTQGIMESNVDLLNDLAKQDEGISNILKSLLSNRPGEIRGKLVSGQEVFPEELEDLLDYFGKVTKGLDQIGANLAYSVPDLVRDIKVIVSDNRLEISARRSLVENFIKVLDQEKIKTKSTEEIKKIDLKSLNFTEQQTHILNKTFDAISDETQDRKIHGSLTEIAKRTGDLALTSKRLEDFEEKKDDTDKSNKDNLLQKGLGALPNAASSGILNAVAAQLGLPGLGNILSGLSEVGGGLFTAGKIGGKIGGKAIGALGSVLGGTAEGIGGGLASGGVGGIVSAVTAALPLILAGTAGVFLGDWIASSLDKVTGGKFSDFVGTPAKKLYDFIHKGQDQDLQSEGSKKALSTSPTFQKYLKATGGVDSDVSQKEFQTLLNTEEGKSQLKGILKGVKAPLGSIVPQKGMTLTSEGSKASASVTAIPQELPVASGLVQSKGVALDTQASILSTQKEKIAQDQASTMANNSNKPVIVQVPAAQNKPTNASIRKSAIDDFGLSLMNTGLLE